MRKIFVATLFLGFVVPALLSSAEKKDDEVKKDTVTVEAEVDKKENIEGAIKTRYDVQGRPVNQRLNAKGMHQVVDVCKLVGGVDTISLNTSTAKGRMDISFLNSASYHGTVTPLTLSSRGNTYTLIPISGKRFIVVSSDVTDTATVRFALKGE